MKKDETYKVRCEEILSDSEKNGGVYPRVDPPISQSIWSMRRIDGNWNGARTSRNLIRGQKKRGVYRHRTL